MARLVRIVHDEGTTYGADKYGDIYVEEETGWEPLGSEPIPESVVHVLRGQTFEAKEPSESYEDENPSENAPSENDDEGEGNGTVDDPDAQPAEG